MKHDSPHRQFGLRSRPRRHRLSQRDAARRDRPAALRPRAGPHRAAADRSLPPLVRAVARRASPNAWPSITPRSCSPADASVLDTTYEVGLSSTSRLHDLFVTHVAMPPGAYRATGDGLDMTWGAAPSPVRHRGADDHRIRPLRHRLCRWRHDRSSRPSTISPTAGPTPPTAATTRPSPRSPPGCSTPRAGTPTSRSRSFLIGTDFEVQVWETLLKIPVGKATTYQSVASHIGRPTAPRAVGAAVGKNPISFVVPCHRVVGSIRRAHRLPLGPATETRHPGLGKRCSGQLRPTRDGQSPANDIGH